MINLSEWLGSKKTKDMLATQGALAAVGLAVLYMAGGDPEKAQALMGSMKEILALIAGVGGVKIIGQAAVDVKKEGKKPE